jgi:hypothetical protein
MDYFKAFCGELAPGLHGHAKWLQFDVSLASDVNDALDQSTDVIPTAASAEQLDAIPKAAVATEKQISRTREIGKRAEAPGSHTRRDRAIRRSPTSSTLQLR